MARAERRSFDWAAIEDDLGLRLPSDYKLLAESFPAGWFRGWVWLRLPEETRDGRTRLLGDFAAGQLEALREFWETGECAFPFPLFPEPGGVLPWGDLRSPGVAYWLTGPGDPDEWPVIVATEDGGYWERSDGPACEFLAEVAAGRYDASRFPDDYEGYDGGRIDLGPRPVFGPAVVPPAGAVQPVPLLGSAADFWPAVLKGAALPVSEVAELRELLGAPPAGVAAVDWAAVHARLGVRLPADYRLFVDTYGPGTLGDIQIMAPGAPGRMDLFELLERKHAQVRELSGVLEARAPFHPEPGGTVCWGRPAGARSPADGPAAGRRAAPTPRNGAWSSCRTRTWRAGVTKMACRSAACSCVTCGRIASAGSCRCTTPLPGRSRLLRTARVPQLALGDRQRQWAQATRGSPHGANVGRQGRLEPPFSAQIRQLPTTTSRSHRYDQANSA